MLIMKKPEWEVKSHHERICSVTTLEYCVEWESRSQLIQCEVDIINISLLNIRLCSLSPESERLSDHKHQKPT